MNDRKMRERKVTAHANSQETKARDTLNTPIRRCLNPHLPLLLQTLAQLWKVCFQERWGCNKERRISQSSFHCRWGTFVWGCESCLFSRQHSTHWCWKQNTRTAESRQGTKLRVKTNTLHAEFRLLFVFPVFKVYCMLCVCVSVFVGTHV